MFRSGLMSLAIYEIDFLPQGQWMLVNLVFVKISKGDGHLISSDISRIQWQTNYFVIILFILLRAISIG